MFRSINLCFSSSSSSSSELSLYTSVYLRIPEPNLPPFLHKYSKHFSNWPISKISFVLVSTKLFPVCLFALSLSIYVRSVALKDLLLCFDIFLPIAKERENIKATTTTITSTTSLMVS